MTNVQPTETPDGRLPDVSHFPNPICSDGFAQRKILFFYQDFGAMGGLERYLLQTARLLQERGAFQPVLACCENGLLHHALKREGLAVYGLPSRAFFSKSIFRMFDLPALFRLWRIVRSEKPDLIHVHIGVLENLLLRRWGLPMAYTVHGYGSLYSLDTVLSPVKRLAKKLIRFFFRETIRRMDTVLFVSHAERKRLREEGYLPVEMSNGNKGEVLQNGLPVKELQENVMRYKNSDVTVLKASLGIPSEARCVSFVNRLDENKGALDFLELARRFSRQPEAQNWVFLMAGDGPLLEVVRQQAADLPNVRVLGFREDIPALLSVSDVLVYPSHREAFGLGLLEAMAAGVPCLAYESGGAKELLDSPETQVCLVPSGDLSAMYNKMLGFIKMPDDEKNTLSQALRDRADLFDERRFIEGLEKVYQRLAPKISVILPVYNAENSLLKAVDSVLGQTYPHLELIVVDDGSTDDGIKKLATIHDPRLKIVFQENQGVAAARNHGFGQAAGDYIAFIDADDVWLPEKLAVEVRVLRRNAPEHGEACLVYSGYYAVDERNRLINLPPAGRKCGDLGQDVLENEGLFLPSTALVHRRIFETVGGFKTACYHEDRVFFIEACQRFPAIATGQRLVMYRQSLSGRCRSVLRNYEAALRADLSIVDTLIGSLSEADLALLRVRQLRNLMFRFLMYGYLDSARKIHQRLQHENVAGDLFSGKKGLLARLSLMSGINLMSAARLVFQALIKLGLAPWWNLKTATLRLKDAQTNDSIKIPAESFKESGPPHITRTRGVGYAGF